MMSRRCSPTRKRSGGNNWRISLSFPFSTSFDDSVGLVDVVDWFGEGKRTL